MAVSECLESLHTWILAVALPCEVSGASGCSATWRVRGHLFGSYYVRHRKEKPSCALSGVVHHHSKQYRGRAFRCQEAHLLHSGGTTAFLLHASLVAFAASAVRPSVRPKSGETRQEKRHRFPRGGEAEAPHASLRSLLIASDRHRK
jgi:hypothetical protein